MLHFCLLLPVNFMDVPKPSSSKNSLFNFFIQFGIVAIIFFVIGFAVGQKKIQFERHGFIPNITVTNKLPPQNQTVDFSLFWDVFETLPQKYIDKSAIDSQKLLYGAISGMVRSLGDPYTAFLDPKQNGAVKDELSGSYEGIGIQIGFDQEKRLAVIAPLSGTPAAKAGLLPKDLILKIDDKDSFDLALPEAVDLIRGPAGTKVKLSLSHQNGQKYDVEIERAKIDVKSVAVEYRQAQNGEVAIIKVSMFGDKTDSEWDAAIDQIIQRKVKGVVVDIRNNPGGLLNSAIHLASEFIKGTVVKEETADGSVGSLPTDHEGKLLKMPLVVLVNGGSASASEIFAGAIQDKNRGKILGEKTFGKGTVQEPIELSGGSALHVTIAKWLTPKGNSIAEKGITPDVIIELSSGDREQNKDPQLDRALELI